MANGADGHVTLATKIDLKGIKDGVKKLGSDVSKGAKKAGESLKNMAKNAATQTKAAVAKVTPIIKKHFEKIKKSAKEAFSKFGAIASKAFLAAGAAALTGIVAMTKQAVEAYGEYEQLVGGIDTLFKGAAGKVKGYAEEAYKTVGLSANEYMQNVTTFSAALISSLGGDTEAAADVANMALTDIADNVNKMGSSYESVQLAFQGFAKQQYMLLDNLKLGYYGTKTEMERLLADAEKITGVKYDINNLADVYNAIHVIQTELGITGTTAKEAATTIQGSAAMMKAAYKNVVTAIGGGGDIEKSIAALSDSIELWINNIEPVVERSIMGIGKAVEKLAPIIVQKLTTIIVKSIPSITAAVYEMILGAAQGIIDGVKALFEGTVTASAKQAVEETKDNTKAVSKNMKATANSAKGAKKAADKMNASFDELNILTGGTSDNVSEIASAAAGETAATSASVPSVGAESQSGGLEQVVSDELALVMEAVGGFAVALGVVLLCFGQFLPGIGFILFGIASGYSGVSAVQENDPKSTVETKLAEMGQAIGAFLAVIGVILVLFGNFPIGLGCIIAGIALFSVSSAVLNESGMKTMITNFIEENATLIAGVGLAMLLLGVILLVTGVGVPTGIALVLVGATALATAVALNPNKIFEDIKKFISDNATLIAGVGIALVILGIIICISGVGLPIGIGLIVAGAAALAAAVALNPEKIFNDVKKFFEDNAGLIVGISIALLILGIILCVTGVGIPIGIGLVVAGAAGLAAEVALNWDFLKEKISGAIEAIGLWLKTWGLLVLGILLCFSLVGLPLGMALIKKASKNLAEAEDPVWNLILEKLKEAWEGISQWYNEKIAPWFTAKKWKDLAGKIGDGLKQGFAAAINGVIWVIEKGVNFAIEQLNKLSIDIPDDIPVIGGTKFGFDLKKVSIPRVELARGGIVPSKTYATIGEAGKEAVLPLERNTEWMDTLAEKLAEKMGGGMGTSVDINFTGTEARLIRYLAPKISQTNKYRGKNLLTGGQV
nr:MAG TPA: tail tape measure protein [Bacteriophage sp.]